MKNWLAWLYDKLAWLYVEVVKPILNFDWLAWLSDDAAKGVFLVLFVLIGVLVWLLPRDYIYEGVENPKWWHNLKLWATGVLAMISVTYLLF